MAQWLKSGRLVSVLTCALAGESPSAVKRRSSPAGERQAFKGLCASRYRFDRFIEGKEQNQSVQWTSNYGVWERCGVRSLPYFNKLFRYVEALHKGWLLAPMRDRPKRIRLQATLTASGGVPSAWRACWRAVIKTCCCPKCCSQRSSATRCLSAVLPLGRDAVSYSLARFVRSESTSARFFMTICCASGF